MVAFLLVVGLIVSPTVLGLVLLVVKLRSRPADVVGFTQLAGDDHHSYDAVCVDNHSAYQASNKEHIELYPLSKS